MNKANLHILSIFLFFFSFHFGFAQEDVTIELGKKNILLEETFNIKVSVANSDKNVSFPEINGFTKGTKQKVYTKSISGYISTQNYTPTKAGVQKVQNASVTVNNKSYLIDAFTITVTSPTEETPDIAEPVLKNKGKTSAFLKIDVDKEKVYVGEGFLVKGTFFVEENNTTQLDFADNLNAQVEEIAKKIKSTDCLEERINITEINGEPVVINSKKYLSYNFFKAYYFPLNTKTISIPKIDLRMVQIGKKNGKKESVVFSDLPKTIKVIDLPEHPLKDKVAVGNFSLVEQIQNNKLNTGKSSTYLLKIVGEGNFSTINMAPPSNDSFFDFFPPDIKEIKNAEKIRTEKQFRYRIIPKDSGQYELKKYFSWVFFNTKTQKYDTLSSRLKIRVSGETISDNNTEVVKDVFSDLDKVDTSITKTNYQEVIKNLFNFLIVLMLLGGLYLFYKKPRKKRNNDNDFEGFQ